VDGARSADAGSRLALDWGFFASSSCLIFARRWTPRLRAIDARDLSPLIA